MSNPDTKSLNFDSLTIGLPVAIFFLLFTIFLFYLRDSIPSFNIVLWIILSLGAFIISSIVNVSTQYINCKTTNIGKSMLGSIPTLLGTLIALGISSVSWCRIPIASFFAPLFMDKVVSITKNKATANINSLKNTNSKECCMPKLTLEMVENKFPLIAGISYGFYIMFGVIFGTVIGTGISSLC